ncbi:hypothetical protein Q9L58_010178 [Maublancomyces gigas]|uniref:Ankyrin repeat-containing domain protein n=1 Tax=Discina gigas TaxID=1032678 RepID=A0ABR3G559_9PEZI
MLLSLPNELILEVVENFTDTTDVFYLLMTNRRLSNLLQPVLVKASKEILDSAAEDNIPLLHYAALENRLTIAKLALKLDPGCLNKYLDPEGTALHVAVFEGFESMVEFLLDQGADPNPVDPNAPPGVLPDTPLHLALSNVAETQIFQAFKTVDEGVVTLLLRRGADPNALIGNGMNSLLQAAHFGLPNIVAAILDTGKTDINSRTVVGSTALHIAVRRSKSGGVPELLLARGIDVNATNDFGQTALFQSRNESVTALLLKYGATVGVVDYKNRTALHYLAERTFPGDSALIARQILSAGGPIDVGLRDKYNRSALDYAAHCGNEELMKVLGEYE